MLPPRLQCLLRGGVSAGFPETYGSADATVTLPTTAEGIYDLLVGDAAVFAALGTYTSNTGATGPAIAVLAANEKLTEGVTVNGIEITITRVPGFAPQSLMNATVTNPTWRIYAIGWQTADGLYAMAERIMALLPGATAAEVSGDAPGSGIGVLDQVVIRWNNPTIAVTA